VSYSIRKPYYKLKQNTTDFFTVAVRHLKSAIVMAESQFEKPYADSDYHQMHLNLPTPDFINGGGGSSQNKDCKGDCDFFIPSFACDEPIVFSVSANYCLAEFNEWLKSSNYPEDERKILGNHWPDDIINLATIVQAWINGVEVGVNKVGITFPFMISCPSTGWKTDDIVDFFATDAFGHMCKASYTIAACACNCDSPPDGVLVFDDTNTADTIVAGSSIEVYVTGGCPPFNFTTSTSGYSFSGGTDTENRSATLLCASGTCGVDYESHCDLTVTDACEVSVTAAIRNTGGVWTSTSLGFQHCVEGGDTYYGCPTDQFLNTCDLTHINGCGVSSNPYLILESAVYNNLKKYRIMTTKPLCTLGELLTTDPLPAEYKSIIDALPDKEMYILYNLNTVGQTEYRRYISYCVSSGYLVVQWRAPAGSYQSCPGSAGSYLVALTRCDWTCP
jgi:hypothetical protein